MAPIEGLASPEALVRGQSLPERYQAAPKAAEVEAEADAPASPGLDVGSEIRKARAAQGPERLRLAGALNEALVRLGQNGGSRQVADVLQRQLESGQFGDLVDAKGRTCRAVATEALLTMGYPYALEISPEDLEHLRQTTAGGGSLLPRNAAVLGLVSLGGIFELFRALPHLDRTVSYDAVALALLAGIAAVAVALTPPESSARRSSLSALLVAGLLGVALSALSGGAAGLVGGLAALVAWALVFLRA